MTRTGPTEPGRSPPCTAHRPTRWPMGVGSLFGSLLSLAATPALALGLADAVSQALLNRPELSAALYGSSAARERVGQAYAGFLPSINLRAAQGSEGTHNLSTQRLTQEYLWLERKDRSISLSQNLFDGFRTLNQLESNQANSRAAAWKAVEAAETLGMRAVESYLTLLKNRAQLRQSEQNWQAHERLLTLAQHRAEYAVGSLAEVSQARSRVKRAEAAVMQARGRKAIAESSVQSLFGLDPEKLEEKLPPMEAFPDYETGLAQALVRHPDILAAQESLQEAQSRARVQLGAYSPSANLVLSSSQGENQGGSEGENNIKSAMLEVTFNLFSGYRDTHIKREAEFLVKQAEETLTKSRLDVTERLANAYRQWQTSQSLVGTHAAQVREANTVREAYLEQYQLGRRTLLDLLDSESELSAAQNSLIDEQFQSLIDAYRVQFSLGNLLVALQIAQPDAAFPESLPSVASREVPRPEPKPPSRQEVQAEVTLSDAMDALLEEEKPLRATPLQPDHPGGRAETAALPRDAVQQPQPFSQPEPVPQGM